MAVGRSKGKGSPAVLGAEGKALGGQQRGIILQRAPLLTGAGSRLGHGTAFGFLGCGLGFFFFLFPLIHLPGHPMAWALLPAWHPGFPTTTLPPKCQPSPFPRDFPETLAAPLGSPLLGKASEAPAPRGRCPHLAIEAMCLACSRQPAHTLLPPLLENPAGAFPHMSHKVLCLPWGSADGDAARFARCK